jgi:hypothetical protein
MNICRGGGVWVLAIALAGGCTKVKEQPPAAPDPPPVQLPSALKKFRPAAPAPSSPWPSAEPGAAPAAAAAPADAGPAPRPLDREALSSALNGALPAVAGCFQAGAGVTAVTLSLDADPSGRVTNVKVSTGGAEAERCAQGALAGVRFPPFEGSPAAVSFPISVQRTVTTAPPSPAPGGGQAPARGQPAPPAGQQGVFINP